MDNLRTEQLEALATAVEYIPRLMKGMETAAAELTGNRQPDTDEFMRKIIDGLNWVIGICNGTLSLINEDGVKLDKAIVNKAATEFSEAYKNNDDSRKAALLKGELTDFLSQFESLSKAAIEAEKN